jgi:hypothetical protein
MAEYFFMLVLKSSQLNYNEVFRFFHSCVVEVHTMESSKARIVKFVKAFATYTESELTEATDELNDDERRSFNTISQKLYQKLQEVNTDVIEGKNLTKKNSSRVTLEQKVNLAITKIENALQQYESEDCIDDWKIEFETGVKYDTLHTIDELKMYHEKLIQSTTSLAHIKLLVFVERGSMYSYLKYSQKFGNWRNLCLEWNICYKTADRYIDLFQILSTYPRLLICDLTFETILVIYKKLYEYLEKFEDLAERLRQPLRQTKIGANMNISPEYQSGNEHPLSPEKLLSANADWNAGWQIADEIEETREQAGYNEESFAS